VGLAHGGAEKPRLTPFGDSFSIDFNALAAQPRSGRLREPGPAVATEGIGALKFFPRAARPAMPYR